MKIKKTPTSITLEFDEDEIKILADSLIDPFAHFEMVGREKIANCKSRLFKEWQERLHKEKRVPSIPTNDRDLLALILDQPDYKNRAERQEAAGLPR